MKNILYHNSLQSTIAMFKEVDTNWQNFKEKELNKINISSTELSILASLSWLATRKQKITLSEISFYCKFDHLTVKNTMDSLLINKYICVLKDNDIEEKDGFMNSDSGLEILHKGLIVVNNAEEDFFSKLTSEDLEVFRNMLKILIL
jgi:hypothetical protein